MYILKNTGKSYFQASKVHNCLVGEGGGDVRSSARPAFIKEPP